MVGLGVREAQYVRGDGAMHVGALCGPLERSLEPCSELFHQDLLAPAQERRVSLGIQSPCLTSKRPRGTMRSRPRAETLARSGFVHLRWCKHFHRVSDHLHGFYEQSDPLDADKSRCGDATHPRANDLLVRGVVPADYVDKPALVGKKRFTESVSHTTLQEERLAIVLRLQYSHD